MQYQVKDLVYVFRHNKKILRTVLEHSFDLKLTKFKPTILLQQKLVKLKES